MSTVEQKGQRVICASVNTVVGLAQLFTVTFCLVGWAWSIGWGIIMVTVASKLRNILII
jgi:hypothetical protein